MKRKKSISIEAKKKINRINQFMLTDKTGACSPRAICKAKNGVTWGNFLFKKGSNWNFVVTHCTAKDGI